MLIRKEQTQTHIMKGNENKLVEFNFYLPAVKQR